MTEALQRAFELAQQQPDEEQEAIAQMIFETFAAEKHWNELLSHPKSATLLDKLAAQAREEYDAGLTHDLDALL